MATGGDVIADDNVIAAYSANWPKLIGIEMEAGGVATALAQTSERPEFLLIKAELSQWPEAEVSFRKAFELEPEKIEYLANVGICVANQGKRDEATKEYLKRSWRPPLPVLRSICFAAYKVYRDSPRLAAQADLPSSSNGP